MIKRISVLALLCLVCAVQAAAQRVASNITSGSGAGNCATVSVNPYVSSTISIDVEGTWSATLTPTVKVSGGIYAGTSVVPEGSTSASSQTTITGNGLFNSGVAGKDSFQICASSYSSGTAKIILVVSAGLNASLFGGGGGGGTNNPGGSAGQIQTNAGAVFGGFTASGDATINTTTGTVTVKGANGTLFSGLATGIAKITTGTGVFSTAVAGDFPTLNQNTTGTASNLSGTPALPNGTTGTTQTVGDNTTKLATDAFVLANSGVGTLTGVTAGTGLNGGGTSGNPTVNLNTALPNGQTATTQTLGDNTTKVATDAFVLANATSASGITNQTQGQLPLPVLSATTLPQSTPYAIFVSAYCQATSSCNPGAGITDESHAIRAIATAYGCTVSNGTSCNIIDDLTGVQYWTEDPLASNFTGRLTIQSTGSSHQIMVDGTDTINLPGSTTFEGMGGTGSDQTPENVTIAMCNALTDLCPSGGFQTQHTTTAVGVSVSGSVMTVTLASGAPFTTTSTAVNHIDVGRWICLSGASTAADNGCFMVGSIVSATAPQSFTLNIDSANQVTCASPCGSLVATLDTPLINFGFGGGGGIFHTAIGNLILDGHGVIGSEAIVNAQGEEGTGTFGTVQMYNFTTGCIRLEQSGIYGGNG